MAEQERPRRRVIHPTYFLPIIALLAATDGGSLTLTIAAIEQAIGRELPQAAHVDQAFWRHQRRSHVQAWHAIGWEARLRRKERNVTWRRVTQIGASDSGQDG